MRSIWNLYDYKLLNAMLGNNILQNIIVKKLLFQ